jgi:hypothetical protein
MLHEPAIILLPSSQYHNSASSIFASMTSVHAERKRIRSLGMNERAG